MNIVEKFKTLNKTFCTGCALCISLCPKKALKLTSNKYGFYQPEVDNTLCIDCGLCVSKCILNENKQILITSNKAFSGYSKNDSIRLASSSGGISEELMKKLLEEGFVVFGCAYKNHKAVHSIATSSRDLSMFRGSKYFQSDTTKVFNYILENRESKVAFFGLPCQAAALNKFIEYNKLDFSNYFIVSIMCYGVPSQLMWEKYIFSLEKKYGAIKEIGFRDKKYGWHTPSLKFSFLKGRVLHFSSPGNEYLDLFYSKNLFNFCCYQCSFRSSLNNEDIRIGDYWGERFKENEIGVSCIIACSKKGDFLLKKTKSIKLETASFDDIAKNQSFFEESREPEFQLKIKDIYIKKGISKAYHFYVKKLGFKKRIVLFIKKTRNIK